MTASDLVVSVIVAAARMSPFWHVRTQGERLAHEWAFWMDVEAKGGWCAAGLQWSQRPGWYWGGRWGV